MKKLLRLFICMLTLIAGIGMAVANPAINVAEAIYALANVNNAQGSVAFSVKGMPTEVDADNDAGTDYKTGFKIPVPDVDGANEIYVHVGNGKVSHTYKIGSESTSKFVKTESGDIYYQYSNNASYTVYYTAVEGAKTYASSKYVVHVEGTSAKFDIEGVENSLPAIAGQNDKMLIPAMKVQDSEGNVLDTDVEVTVWKNSTQIAVGSESDLTEDAGNLYLKTSSCGTYTVRYFNEEYNLSKDFDIDVTENFDSSKVKFSAATMTMKQVELGKTATFPKPNVTDTGNNQKEIPLNVVISIYSKKDTTNPIKTLDANTYEYTFAEAGSYIVKYEISNYYLNNKKTETIQIAEDVVVADTIAPEVSFANGYETTDDNWQDDVEILGDWAVPTKSGYSSITFPALYASDLGTSYSNLTFQRVLRANNGEEYDIDKKQSDLEEGSASYLYNASLPENYVKDVTKSVEFTFPKKDGESDEDYVARIKGSYTLIYRATEIVGENSTERTGSKSVSIQILGVDADSYNDETHLSISLPSLATEMKSSDKKTITVPSATDDSDKAIETHYYYYYGQKGAFESAFDAYKGSASYATNYANFKSSFDSTAKLNELTVTDKKLALEFADFDTSSVEDKSRVTVVAVAINDQGHFVYDAKEIKIKNATTDNDAPTGNFIGSGFDKHEYILGVDTKIALPQVEFFDNLDEKLTVSVQYYVNTPEEMRPVNGLGVTYDSMGKKATVEQAYINPSQAGTYYVVYTAIDDSNNVYELVTCFEVKKETSYSIKVEYNNNLNIHESTDIIATVVDDEGNEIDTDVSIYWTSLSPTSEDKTYTFNYAGDYSFVAKAYYDGKNIESAKCAIKVNDIAFKWDDENNISVPSSTELSPNKKEYEVLTEKPSDWDDNYGNYYFETNGSYSPVTSAEEWEDGKIYKKNEVVYVQLTVPTASKNGLDKTVAEVKVVDPSGDEVEIYDVIVNGKETGDKKFLALKDGKYTITYTVGSGDNKLTKTLYTTVGDYNKPVVKLSNKDKLEKDVTYSGEDITLTLSWEYNEPESSSEQNVYKVLVTRTTGSGDSKKVSKTETTLVLYDIDRLGNKVKLTWAEAIKNENITLNGKTSSSSSSYVWTISSVGDYTLEIKAQDSNENISNFETVKFKVVDESSATEKKDNKTGIILIVVSLVVLAGLICFFAFGGKAKSNAPKSSKPKKEENKADETQEKTE